jgi:uncharacterized protein YndB with AHSA1/START domain
MKTIAPVVKQATVPLAIEEAFTAFTDEIGAWWPLATHSIALDNAVGVTMAPHAGGQITETAADGTTHVWGTITAWAPPTRVAFTWHPGNPPDEATNVEVVFDAAGPKQTLVILTHTGWENRPDAAQARDHYDPGWDLVFGKYVAKVGAKQT